MKIINDDLVQLDNLTETDIDELCEMVVVIGIYKNGRAYVPKDQWDLVPSEIKGMFE